MNVLTGGTSGVYFPRGLAIGKICGDKIPEVKTRVQATKASVENLILLQQGSVPLIVSQMLAFCYGIMADPSPPVALATFKALVAIALFGWSRSASCSPG